MITGIVVDSLHGGVAAGAIVAIDGTAHRATVSDDGSFSLDSVAAGQYQLRLLHPSLDTVGVRVLSPAFDLRDGEAAAVTLALPSEGTLVRARCGVTAGADTAAALLGIVLDGDGAPVAAAEVRLTWTELRIGRRSGIQRSPQYHATETAADGRFTMCGLPPGITGQLVARAGADSTAPIGVSFGGSLLAARALVLAPGARARVHGTVSTVDGTPIAGARVALHPGPGGTVTDSAGRFALDGQPAGTGTLIVRRVGFQPAELTVHLDPHVTADVRVTMAAFVAVLDEVVVRQRVEAALDRVGYAARLRAGMGRFMSADDIEHSGAVDMIDLLRRFQQLRVVITPEGERVLVGRPIGFDSEGCIHFFIDGQPWLGDVSPLTFIQPREVGAVEVYSAATTPAEFTRAFQICETVVIWTRYGLRVR
jgi:hypothetical protein